MNKTALASIVLAGFFVNPANATECKGLLYHIFGVDTGLSCEQRRALRETGFALMQQGNNLPAPPPPQPMQLQQIQPPPMPITCIRTGPVTTCN